MKKSDYFKEEIDYVKDENNKHDLKKMINLLPDYFFQVPASSTGKYHPIFANGEGGLYRHTKVVAKIAMEMLEVEDRFNDNDKELIVIASVMHDGFKYGKEKEEYTRVDHPLISSKIIMENSKKFKMSIDNLRRLCMMIESHMGKFNKDFKGNIVLPLPRNELERFLHKCDYLASRKFIGIHFEKYKIVNFKEENNEKE